MIDTKSFFNALKLEGIDFFTGVPDSLLKDICAFITDNSKKNNHIISSNEGASVALASGYHLATGKIPMVYLQNSGLGNTINPLTSLADREVYQIPMILMIGWRGQPEIKDEPQHIKQGRVQNALLNSLEIPYFILNKSVKNIEAFINEVVDKAKFENSPIAIVVEKDTFKPYKLKSEEKTNYSMNREGAIGSVLGELSSSDVIVSTTGKTSREVFEYREEKNQGHQNDFLTVGSMGHTSQIALGISLKSDKRVICLDGDGAVIMHLGSLAINGTNAPSNFYHIVINNGAHDSVGGQPTAGFQISLPDIAKGCGYNRVLSVSTKEEVQSAMKDLFETVGPCFLEIKVNKGARSNLGRPTTSPVENKMDLMRMLLK